MELNPNDIKQLNREVAKKVLGYHIYHYDKDYSDNCYYLLMDARGDMVARFDAKLGIRSGCRKTEEEAWDDVPDFYNDPIAWDKLMIEIEALGRWVSVGRCNGKWGPRVFCWAEIGQYGNQNTAWNTGEVGGDTPGHALCLAALKLYEEEVG